MDSPRQTGLPLTRAEDVDLLRGKATFTADIVDPRLDGALFAAFVRSPVANGTITAIDASTARQAPGVAAVVTAEDVWGADDTGPLAPYALPLGDDLAPPLLPLERVSHAGQVLAVVVAESPALAADAIEAVHINIEPAAPLLDLDEAARKAPITAVRHEMDHDPTYFEADVVVSLRHESPRQLPFPIEGRSVAAVLDDDRLLVWAATQTPHAMKANLAKLFAMSAASIRVVAPAVGGGFGGKVSRSVEEYLVPLMARRLGRPVRWNENRSEYFATATQGRGERIDITLAGTKDGQITALQAHLLKDAGAFPLVGVMLANGYTIKMANGCYDIPHVEFSSRAALTNRPSTSAYRGAGRSAYLAALERTVDRFAAEVGLDPADVRRRNLITPDQMPYATTTDSVYDEADYPGDLEAVLAAAGYDELRTEQARRRQAGENPLLGIGMACYNHMTTGGGGEEAVVAVQADGSATVVTGTTSQGHGHATTWAQIASDVLGIAVEDISVVEGDTDAIATGVGAVGSRSLQTAGLAIHRAATDVVERARQLVADHLEASFDDIVQSADGLGFHVVGTPARTVGWGEVAAQTESDEVSCGDFYDTEGRNTFPSGAHLAVVEVDPETGDVALRRLVTVDDAGTVVNPMIVEGQIHGGVASAVGQVLGEVIAHDETGNQLTNSLIDYGLPSSDQLPSFEVALSPTASSLNILGVKGVGESGTVGATGAVHNAVIDALSHLGVEHLELPCTPERVWNAIRTAS